MEPNRHLLHILRANVTKYAPSITGVVPAQDQTENLKDLHELCKIDYTDLHPLQSSEMISDHIKLMYKEFVSLGGKSLLEKQLAAYTMDEDQKDEDLKQPSASKRKRVPEAEQLTVDLLSLPVIQLMSLNVIMALPTCAYALMKADSPSAKMLLKLALAVNDDAEQQGGCLSAFDEFLFKALPYKVLLELLDSKSAHALAESSLRKEIAESGLFQLLLASIDVNCQQVKSVNVSLKTVPGVQFVLAGEILPAKMDEPPVTKKKKGNRAASRPDSANKGTGYGFGTVDTSRDVAAMKERQMVQEMQACRLFRTLAAYIRGNLEVEIIVDQIKNSHLIACISSYLQNKSMMDLADRVPVYSALFCLVRSLFRCDLLLPALLQSSAGNQSILGMFRSLYDYVEKNTASYRSATATVPDSEDEIDPFDYLVEDMRKTWTAISSAVTDSSQEVIGDDSVSHPTDEGSSSQAVNLSPDQLYCSKMGPLRFESYDFTEGTSEEDIRFTVGYHYEDVVKTDGVQSQPNRMKRLVKEVAMLRDSLPLSASSTIFIRTDTSRPDIMKALLIGPAGTPYQNGCFEFDLYFPPNYPLSPLQVHLVTGTKAKPGGGGVRFNPNLYADGKVCLSVLNTWDGKPEEMWNPLTSTILQVLVSIQSFILVSEPHFNEPVEEKHRGTLRGMEDSRIYNEKTRRSTLEHAMIKQLKTPSPCFTQVILSHFWLKRQELTSQLGDWISELEQCVANDPADSGRLKILKVSSQKMKDELARMSPPGGFQDLTVPSTDGPPIVEVAMN